jgi:hypothetical protein
MTRGTPSAGVANGPRSGTRSSPRPSSSSPAYTSVRSHRSCDPLQGARIRLLRAAQLRYGELPAPEAQHALSGVDAQARGRTVARRTLAGDTRAAERPFEGQEFVRPRFGGVISMTDQPAVQDTRHGESGANGQGARSTHSGTSRGWCAPAVLLVLRSVSIAGEAPTGRVPPRRPIGATRGGPMPHPPWRGSPQHERSAGRCRASNRCSHPSAGDVAARS